jgi:hypothetical protein
MLKTPVAQGIRMTREFSGWGVIATGGLLALVGGYWLVAGWEHIQIERGWSQFIAGAMALSGGVVTMAIGRLIRFLARRPSDSLATQTAEREPLKPLTTRPAVRAPEPPKRARPPEQHPPVPPVVSNEAYVFDSPETPAPTRIETTQRRGRASDVLASRPEIASSYTAEDLRAGSDNAGDQQPAEVDRYTAGDSTYVMYSDGSVCVRTPEGTRRYESLDALRADSGER